MTTVAGLEHRGTVWLGGDSAISTEDTVALQTLPKVFKRANVVIGIAGQCRLEPVMRHIVNVPNFKRGDDPDRWVNVDLASAIRKAVTGEGLVIESGWFDLGDSALLVGVGGQLFVIESDLCGWRPLPGFHAIGSGGDKAVTSLKRTANGRLKPRTRLKQALEDAASETPFTRPPWTFESA